MADLIVTGYSGDSKARKVVAVIEGLETADGAIEAIKPSGGEAVHPSLSDDADEELSRALVTV